MGERKTRHDLTIPPCLRAFFSILSFAGLTTTTALTLALAFGLALTFATRAIFIAKFGNKRRIGTRPNADRTRIGWQCQIDGSSLGRYFLGHVAGRNAGVA